MAEHENLTDPLPPLREVIDRYGLLTKKALGQNFLLDLNLTRRIAREARVKDLKSVLEIGPGPGGLTRALLMEGAPHVVAIEKDERCIPALEDIRQAYDQRLHYVQADALDIETSSLGLQYPCAVVANLPYNIGTQLLTNWVAQDNWPPFFERLVLMFQREVAQRIIAKVGEDAYGRLSVLCGWRTDARILFTVPPQAFWPPPKVTSAVVSLMPKKLQGEQPRASTLAKITQAAFGQRRKMLRQSLRSLTNDPLPMLEAIGLDPAARAETIPVEAYVAMALWWEKHQT